MDLSIVDIFEKECVVLGLGKGFFCLYIIGRLLGIDIILVLMEFLILFILIIEIEFNFLFVCIVFLLCFIIEFV